MASFKSWIEVASCFLLAIHANAKKGDFLEHEPSFSVESVRADLDRAMALGSSAFTQQHQEIMRAMAPIFRVLPKNAQGRIERPMLRYSLHRFFLQRYSIQVRGLEPTQNSLNARALVDGSEIYRHRVPSAVEAVLEGRFGNSGFSLEDTVAVAATLEQLVLEPRGKAIEDTLSFHWTNGTTLTRQEAVGLLEDYTLLWLAGDDAGIEILNSSRAEIEEAIPQWAAIKDFTHGEIDRLEHMRQHGSFGNPFVQRFTIDDVNSVASQIIAGFGSWWEQECQAIKAMLVTEDPEVAGRVRLSDFYHRSIDGEWRFSESQAYLRDLGALDDSSRWNGPQVIIPNYMQGPSNCIISSTYYMVCCVNECEALMGQVEDHVRAPVATAQQILDIVGNMTEDGEQEERLIGTLARQLDQIAKKHKGKIPLHGRLFGQWMHYAFPQECPFPHRAGELGLHTPQEFGDDYLATTEDMKAHAKEKLPKLSKPPASRLSKEEQDALLMSQWTEDEELLTQYAELSTPWGLGMGQVPLPMVTMILLLSALAYVMYVHFSDEKSLSKSSFRMGARPYSV